MFTNWLGIECEDMAFIFVRCPIPQAEGPLCTEAPKRHEGDDGWWEAGQRGGRESGPGVGKQGAAWGDKGVRRQGSLQVSETRTVVGLAEREGEAVIARAEVGLSFSLVRGSPGGCRLTAYDFFLSRTIPPGLLDERTTLMWTECQERDCPWFLCFSISQLSTSLHLRWENEAVEKEKEKQF